MFDTMVTPAKTVNPQASQRTSLPATPVSMHTQTSPATSAAQPAMASPEVALVHHLQCRIEARQTQSCSGAVDEGGNPAQPAKIAQRPLVHDQGGCRTKTDHIGKRVIPAPKADWVLVRRHPPIQAIEHHGDEDGHRRPGKITPHGLHDGENPANNAAVVNRLGST